MPIEADSAPTITAYGPRHGLSELGLHARAEHAEWRLVRALTPMEFERLRRACECMLSEQATQVLGWLDPTQRLSPLDSAEHWGWDAVQRALDADRAADEIPW